MLGLKDSIRFNSSVLKIILNYIFVDPIPSLSELDNGPVDTKELELLLSRNSF